MKTVAGHKFPETPEESQDWKPAVYRSALDRSVLCVARTRLDFGGSWAAYVMGVPGKSHEQEQDSVLRDGTKLREEIAREIFGFLEDLPYAP